MLLKSIPIHQTQSEIEPLSSFLYILLLFLCLQDSRLTQLEAAVQEEDWEEAASEEEETEGGDDDGSEGTEGEAENQNDFEQAFGSGEDDDQSDFVLFVVST